MKLDHGSVPIAFLGVMLALAVDAQGVEQPEDWRREHRIIDLHQHIDCTTQHLARAVKIMDTVGVGLIVNLSGGTVTPGAGGAASEFERNKRLAEALFRGRFL